MWIILLIIIKLTVNQEVLKIEKTNILKDKNQYNCILSNSEISKSKKEIKYIIFDFPKEKKNKRNEVYISTKEDKAINRYTIYKLPLFGSNKIIIPYEYMKLEENLYIKIICYKNEKCNEEIIINIYNKIAINEGETLYLNGYKENYIYNFVYNYKNNDIKGSVHKQISVYSHQKNDFEFNLYKNKNTNIKSEHILNGYLYNIKKEDHKDCGKDCEFELEIKIKKQSAYIMIQIISIDNSKDISNIDLIRPIVGIIKNKNEKKCFYIDEKDNEEYFIDFMIEEETQSIIFEYNNLIKKITFSQTIKYKSSEGKFCLIKLYSKVESISFSFTVYIPDTNDYYSFTDSQSFIRNKSFLGLLYNGYLYRKIIKESDIKNSYYPSEYNGNILYFYLYVIRGVVQVSNLITSNFPFNNGNNNDEEEYFKLMNINNIGNEYFGTILIRNQNELNSSPMDANKNIFLVNCESGVTFNDEQTNYCEYNIMFYTENDLINLRINEKFSYLNYDKIKLKMRISQNTNINKLIIDLYTYFDFSYINILNKDNDSSLNTFYNGHLITNEFIFNKNINDQDLDIIYYDIEVISYDHDFVSISINGNNNEEDKNILEKRFWLNDYILTTLTKRIPNKKIVIDHIPRAATELNYFKIIIFLSYLNCQININLLYKKEDKKNYFSGFQDTIDNNNLIVLEADFSELKNKIEFEMDLIKANNNEPVCMIYFSTFLIDDMGLSTLYPILIRENIDTPIILSSKINYIITLEYIILNYNSPIIISISFEEMVEIYLSYSINNEKIEDNSILFSQNIIIYENEIKDKCKISEKNILCKLKIDIGRKTRNIDDNKNILLNINIKSNYENHVSYLNSNTLIDGIILGDQFKYYYTNIRQNDSGFIILNNKKGIGLMYARIINKNIIDGKDKNWNGRIHLLNREELENCDDCLIYDINKNEIIINEKDTKDCSSDLRCQIIIGVANIENKNEDNIDENDIFEYSIYFLKNNINNEIYGNIKIQSNKYIQGNLYDDKINNKIVYDYFIPENVEIIKYELQCNGCSLNLITNNLKIKQENIDEKMIDKYSSKIIKFEKDEKIELYYHKTVSFEISLDKKVSLKYNIFFFKISLVFKGMIENILLLNSEMNSICYKECFYLIPIYFYDKLTSLTMSISDSNLKAKVNSKLDFTIYDSIKYYEYIMTKDKTNFENKDFIETSSKKIESNKNYIIFEEKEEFKNMIIIGHIKITNDLNYENYQPYQIYFTYSKNSRKNYFLYPNINNLLYINKNSEIDNIKEIRIPDLYLINNINNNNNNQYEEKYKDSSIITFSHIKGKGVVDLVTNNYYLHNNFYKLYSELKSFIFDNYHSFFQINYNKNSKFAKKFLISSEEGLYAYSKMTTNIFPKINEIKLGKSNYILHQYDSSPIYLFIKIDDINEIENDITLDIKIEGLEIYKKYNISLTGYFSYSKDLNIGINNYYEYENLINLIKNLIDKNIKFPISKGFYDNITNIGIITFKSKSMKMYYEKNNINLLVINILDMDYNKNQSIDVMIKSTPIPNQLILKDNIDKTENNLEFSIPQFEHYFSFFDCSIKNYSIYKLNINERNSYISFELLYFDNDTDFCFIFNKSNSSHDNLNFCNNETNLNIFKVIDERNKNGKRSIILKIEKDINEIYLVIFKKNIIDIYEKIFFAIKYYSFPENDYLEGKYLYKNRFTINNTNIIINKINNNYLISWDKIELIKTKEEKGELKIDYYLKILNKLNKNFYNYNNALFNYYINDKNSIGFHLINKNELEIDKNIFKENIIGIYLIARFNELNGMENYFAYQPLIFNIKEDNNIIDKNKNNEKSNDEYNNDKKKKNIIIFVKTIILLLIIFITVLIIIYIYKLIRKIQIKNIYEKYINDNKKYPLYNEKNIINESFESKISFLIES